MFTSGAQHGLAQWVDQSANLGCEWPRSRRRHRIGGNGWRCPRGDVSGSAMMVRTPVDLLATTRDVNSAAKMPPTFSAGYCSTEELASEARIAGAAACRRAIMAECVRVANDAVFVAAGDPQAVVTAEMRELICEALDLLADKEG